MSAQTHLPIVIFKDAADAVAHGFKYNRPEYQNAEIINAVVVRDGTVSGKPTVDFIIEDEYGQKHVVMLTAALLETLGRCL